MANQPKLILVTGATGRQGGAVVRRLLRQGQKVRALTRHPDKAEELAGAGAEVIKGDMTDPASLEAALRGMQGVFAISTPFEAGHDAEIKQGIEVANAAKKAGIEHYIYTSVLGADRHTGIPHFASKWRIEQHVRQIGLPATILRPAFFMENLSAPAMRRSIFQGALALPLPPSARLQMVAVKDIAEFAAAAFLRPEDFLGRTIELTGDAPTMEETAAHLSRVLSRTVAFQPLQPDQMERVYGRDPALMSPWFKETGATVDRQELLRQYGIPLTSLADFLATEPFGNERSPAGSRSVG